LKNIFKLNCERYFIDIDILNIFKMILMKLTDISNSNLAFYDFNYFNIVMIVIKQYEYRSILSLMYNIYT